MELSSDEILFSLLLYIRPRPIKKQTLKRV